MFILARPDCARIVEEFEAVYAPPPSSIAHHEEGHSLQVKFRKDVLSFVDVVVHVGNPFIATRQEHVALDTHNSMSWNRSLLLLYPKPCNGASPSHSICHGKAGKGFSTDIRFRQSEQHVHLRQPT